jgi:hypothetical protein
VELFEEPVESLLDPVEEILRKPRPLQGRALTEGLEWFDLGAFKAKQLGLFEPLQIMPVEIDTLEDDGENRFRSLADELRQLVLLDVLRGEKSRLISSRPRLQPAMAF